MKEGEIIFNGFSSLELNMKLTEYPSVPMTNEEYEEVTIEGRNGSVYINKGTYPDKKITFVFTKASNKLDIDLEFIQDWLTNINDNRLIYCREDRCYLVKKVVIGEFLKEFKTYGNIEVTFICEPFSSSLESLKQEITQNNFILYYSGTAKSDTLIRIYGSGNVQLTIDNETMLIKNIENYVDIDSKLMQIRDSNGQSKDYDSIGDFVTFEPGLHNISYMGTVTKIKVEYYLRYK